MVKIDLKDRKILYELDLNCRQSNTHIGKKVGLKKDVVSYRIKRMEEERIIKNYWTAIDAFKLGYIVFRFYLVFQYVTPEKKQEIIDYFVKYKNSWVVTSIKGGGLDLAVVIWVKNIQEFHNFWMKTLDLYGNFFAKKIFSAYLQAYAYHQSYLLPEKYNPSDRLHYEVIGHGGSISIDKLDYQIISQLATNARMPLVDLSDKIDCSSQTVNYRLKNLLNKGIIQGFRTSINISKLGLEHFKTDIYLSDHNQRLPIIKYIQTNPNLIYLNTSAGYSDLEFEFFLENADALNQIITEISKKFENSIRNYSYVNSEKVHIIRCMPEIDF